MASKKEAKNWNQKKAKSNNFLVSNREKSK